MQVTAEGLSSSALFWMRPVVAVAVLTYLPGFLALRLLNLDRRPASIQIPLEVGVSLAMLMTVGWLMSIAYPLVGINRPLAQVPVTVTCGVLISALLAANGTRRRRSPDCHNAIAPVRLAHMPWSSFVYASLAALTPPFAVLAATVFGTSGDNRLMVSLFLIVMALIIWAGLRRPRMAEAYPLVVFALSLSLVLARTLIGRYISGWDIQWEYFFAQKTTEFGAWNINDSSSQLNSTLSVAVLPTILTRITGLPTTWVFKLLYPLFLSLSAPVLYELYRRYVTRQQAMLATLFVVSCNVYYFALPQAVRMEIAFLFLALALYLLFEPKQGVKNAALIMFCVWGLIVAHYSSAFIFAAWLSVSAFVFRVARSRLKKWYLYAPAVSPGRAPVILFTVITSYAWYAFTSRGITVREVGIVMEWSWRLLSQTFTTRTHNGMISEAVTGAHLNAVQQVARFLYLGTTALLLLGFVTSLLNRRSQFALGYMALAGCAAALLLGTIFLPGVSIAYDTGRMYLQSSVVLAPFFVLAVYGGVRAAMRVLACVVPSLQMGVRPLAAWTSAILVAAYFGFQVGVINTLTGYQSTVVLDPSGPQHDALFLRPGEVAAANWLHNAKPRGPVYADSFGWMRLESYGLVSRGRIRTIDTASTFATGSTLYLDSVNVTRREATAPDLQSAGIRYVPLVLPPTGPGESRKLATVYDGRDARVMVSTGRLIQRRPNVSSLDGGR